jgi:cell division inhibitor SepF
VYRNNLLDLPGTTNRIPEIVIIEPLDSLEASSAIQALRQWKIVILKLSKLEPNQAQRVVDFITGGTCAINGHTQLISEYTFLFAPNCVQIVTQASVAPV